MKRWGVLAGLVLARLAWGMQYQSVASAGPELSARFGLDYAALGTLVGTFMAAGIALSLPWGLLGRWRGERAAGSLGLLLMLAGGGMVALAAGVPGIGWGRVVAGAGGVAVVVMQGKMVSDRFAGPAFLPAMGLVLGGFPVGVGLAGLFAAPFGWAGLTWLCAAPAVLAFVLVAVCADAAPHRSRLSFPTWRECALVAAAALVWTAYNGAYYAFLAYMPSVVAGRGGSAALAALVVAVGTWSNLPASVLAGWAASRVGAGRVFLVGTLVTAGSMAALWLTPFLVVPSVLFGTLGGMHAGVMVGLGTRSTRPENQAVGMGIFYTIYYAGSAGLPALCGHVADAMGDPGAALGAGAALSLLCLPFWGLHRVLRRPKPAPVPA